MWDTGAYPYATNIFFLDTLHLLRAVTLCIIMHVPPQLQVSQV
jgi:hypothetical protein